MPLTARPRLAADANKSTTKRNDRRVLRSGAASGSVNGDTTRESKRPRFSRSTATLAQIPDRGNAEHSDDGNLIQPARQLEGRASDRKSQFRPMEMQSNIHNTLVHGKYIGINA